MDDLRPILNKIKVIQAQKRELEHEEDVLRGHIMDIMNTLGVSVYRDDVAEIKVARANRRAILDRDSIELYYPEILSDERIWKIKNIKPFVAITFKRKKGKT